MRAHLVCALLVVTAAAVRAEPQAPSEKPMVTAARLNAQLAVAYLQQGDIAVAQEKIDRALTQNPRDAAVQLSAALVYERLQQPARAAGFYAAAFKIQPHNPDLLNSYAVFECRSGHFAQGQKLFEQAARNAAYTTPEVAFANAGVCARSAGNLVRAEELFRKALDLRPDFPDALLQLADLSFTRGAGLPARGLLERYFQVAPPTPDALSLGLRIERALGDRGAAARYAGQLQHDFPDSEQARQLRSSAGGE